MNIRSILAAVILAVTVLLVAVPEHGPVAAAVFLFVAGNLYAPQTGRLCVTLTATEILVDVIKAFAKRVPAARLFGHEFRSKGGLKLNKSYIAHIASLPAVEDVTTTYAVTGTDARSLLSDIEVTVDKRKGVRLYWSNLQALQDDKGGREAYQKVIDGAGYQLGKAFVDDLLTMARSEYFSQSSAFAVADSDVDMLNDVTTDMNLVGADSNRVLLVNSLVAQYLNADPRLTSRDYAGQLQGEDPYRIWRNTNGFKLIQEYPDFPTQNSTAITGISAEADDDLLTKVAHGLVTGQRVELTAITNGAGLTQGNYYFVIRSGADTFKLASTLPLAIAGTGINITTDGTSITVTPKENLTGFATDTTGIQFLAGPEDHAPLDSLAEQLGVPKILKFDTATDPISGITMTGVAYQEANTGNIAWMPVLLWGKNAGRKAGTNAVGSFADYGGHLLRSA